MREPNGGYGRDGDLESEIAEILAECSSGSDSPTQDGDDINEMARRYGVDVPEIKYNPNYGSRQSYPPQDYGYPGYGAYPMPYGGMLPYGQQMPYYPSAPRQEYDENGSRIVYDADSARQQAYSQMQYGYSMMQPPVNPIPENTIPSASQRRKYQQDQRAVKVLYDADTSAKTAYEAPFENLGDKNAPVRISDGLERTQKKKKNSKKSAKSQKTGGMSKARRAFKVFIPWNGDSKKEKIRKIIMDVSFFVLFFCAIYFMNYFIELKAAQKITITPGVPEQVETEDLSAQWAAIKAMYPNVNFPDGMNIDYALNYAVNQDFAGWISIDNTNIDQQVVKGSDNEYYLKHDFRKNDTKYGCSFMDYRNNLVELDRNTIIYGHHMKDNMLFAQLEKYGKIDGFKESPVIQFNTLYHNYTWKVYAAFISNSAKADDNGYMFNFIVPNFHTVEAFTSYIDAVNERSLYTTGVDINENDKILTLSTCAYDFNNARLVVIARLVRDGENPDVDVEKAVVNENPRYPQKWYDVKGKSNPYRNAYKWEPNQDSYPG